MIHAEDVPRLLRGTPGTPLGWSEHQAAFATTTQVTSLLDELDAAGVTGRGGAAFPTARKARLVRSQRGHHKSVIVNAMEGEPASHKDALLLSTNPHLVLDGAEILATIIGARRVVVCVARNDNRVVAHVNRAIHERTRRRLRGIEFELQTPPWRYVAGEESALVHWLNDHESLPTRSSSTTPRPAPTSDSSRASAPRGIARSAPSANPGRRWSRSPARSSGPR